MTNEQAKKAAEELRQLALKAPELSSTLNKTANAIETYGPVAACDTALRLRNEAQGNKILEEVAHTAVRICLGHFTV